MARKALEISARDMIDDLFKGEEFKYKGASGTGLYPDKTYKILKIHLGEGKMEMSDLTAHLYNIPLFELEHLHPLRNTLEEQ